MSLKEFILQETECTGSENCLQLYRRNDCGLRLIGCTALLKDHASVDS